MQINSLSSFGLSRNPFQNKKLTISFNTKESESSGSVPNKTTFQKLREEAQSELDRTKKQVQEDENRINQGKGN